MACRARTCSKNRAAELAANTARAPLGSPEHGDRHVVEDMCHLSSCARSVNVGEHIPRCVGARMPGKPDAWMVPAHPGSVLKKNRKQKMHTYGTYRHRGPDGLIVLQRNDALLMPRMCSDVSQRGIR